MGENDWHGYVAIQRLNLGAGNWAELLAVFEQYGDLDSPYPSRRCHWRTSLDGDARIYEAAFTTDEVSIAGFKRAMATEFGVNVEDIECVPNGTTFVVNYSPYWTFKYPVGGDSRFRVGIFGGLSSTWWQSLVEVLGYLAANAEDWEPAEE